MGRCIGVDAPVHVKKLDFQFSTVVEKEQRQRRILIEK